MRALRPSTPATFAFLILAAIIAYRLVGSVALAQLAGVPQDLPETPLMVETDTGVHDFMVMVADDAQERATGLMFREDMSIDQGMLFVFPRAGPRAFWMQNTPLPLDIIFIDAEGRVVNIAKRTTPFSLDSIPSAGDARFVLELRGGVSDLIGLAPGDQVRHAAIGNMRQ